jgi:hypothetical protein
MDDRFTFHRSLVTRGVATLAASRPLVPLLTTQHGDACSGWEACLHLEDAFPCVEITASCLGTQYLCPIGVETTVWLGEGWKIVRDAVIERARLEGVKLIRWKSGKPVRPVDIGLSSDPWHRDPRIAAFATGKLAEAWEAWMWHRITEDLGRGLLLTPLLAMEYADALGATVDWTGLRVSVRTNIFYKPSEVLGTRTAFRYGIERVWMRAGKLGSGIALHA